MNLLRTNIIKKELHIIFIVVVAFVLPFYRELLPYAVAAVIVSWLFSNHLKQKVQNVLMNKYFIMCAVFYFLHILGLFYSKNISEGLFNLEVKLSLIIIPLVVFSSQNEIMKYKTFIYKSFIAGVSLSVTICYIRIFYKARIRALENEHFNFDVWNIHSDKSFFQLILTGDSFFNYEWFSYFIHVNYFSMYIIFAICLVVYNFLSNKSMKTWSLILFIYLFSSLLLIQSRATLVALFFLLVYFIFHTIIKARKKILIVAILSTLLAITFFIIFNSNRFKKLYSNKNSTSYETSYEIIKDNSIRIHLWEKAINLSSENIIIGVGTGDVTDSFKEKYTKEIYNKTGGKYLNIHNEFLETMVRIGIVGLISLLILLSYPLFIKKKKTDNDFLIYILFFILITIQFFFESMLVRINGVLFFTFFYSILNVNPQSNHSKKN